MGSAGGTGSAGFVAGGERPGIANATEEWTVPSSTQNQTLTAS